MLTNSIGVIRDIRAEDKKTGPMLESGVLMKQFNMLKKFDVQVDDLNIADKPLLEYLESAGVEWRSTIKHMHEKKEEIAPLQNQQMVSVKAELDAFFLKMRDFRGTFRKNAPFEYEVGGENTVEKAYEMLDSYEETILALSEEMNKYHEVEELFEIPNKEYVEIEETLEEMGQLKYLIDNHAMVDATYNEWRNALWSDIDTESFDTVNKKIMKSLRTYTNNNGIVKAWQIYKDLEQKVKDMAIMLPLVNDLHSHAMRPRHWLSLAKICNVESIDVDAADFSFDSLLALNLSEHADDVEEVIEIAGKELKLDKSLTIIEKVWAGLEILFSQHKNTEIKLIKVPDEVIESLEDHQLQLQTMIGMGKFVDFFRDRVLKWQRTLGDVEGVLKEWTNVTKQWASLETIFLASEDIRSQLPDDTKRFEGIDAGFKELMKEAEMVPNAAQCCSVEGREELLKGMTANLELCQRALNEYLDMKKKIFPRFYFVSNTALLEILSNGNNPPKIMKHLPSCYDALANLTFCEGTTKEASAMTAKDGEVVVFSENFVIKRPAVEDWLNDLTTHMQTQLKEIMSVGLDAATQWEVEKPRHMWVDDYPAQVVLNDASCIMWSEETEAAIEEFGGGQEDALKNHVELTNKRLNDLIGRVLGYLSKPLRRKIIALITLDVHGRDVIKKLVVDKIDDPGAFLWSQQLRFYWDNQTKNTLIKICDYRTLYSYEYIGNTGRLVITPLTDRCYITLTTALRLMLSGAPAGPAGTGKTETTKDLGRALALPVYVFNCSPQMNYQTVADIFKGLAQTGSWGCFDEFNRIIVEVLSVVATQVKTIQDAIVYFAVPANRSDKYKELPPGQPPVVVGEFVIMDDTITLIPTCGIFITMNPGYAGRAELPENLKVLFRSCAMIRPDLEPICENMLMSEGYGDAPMLAKKFTTLYSLCKALLSPQIHYDWGLRAVKSVLRVGGQLKRDNPTLDEECVLMRALRDFNTPKIPAHDIPVFLRLIRDLFPKYAENTPPVFDDKLREKAHQVALDSKLIPHEQLLIKVVQFQELLDVRHSVMLLGPAGCGKTSIWQTLLGCDNLGQQKKVAIAEPVNPKAVTNEELFGYMTLSKDWKDGCLSIVMRGMSANDRDLSYYDYQTTKWVVLDDDIDTLWIESMNTVMDANKVLTLVSNERIPLSAAMRMVFEIDSLQNASPATVSRAGILYINETDIGWRPRVDAWVQNLDYKDDVKVLLERLVDKYMETIEGNLGKDVKNIIPLRILAQAGTVCSIMSGIFDAGVNPEDLTEVQLESYFVFACTWAYGGGVEDNDQKKRFHEVWTSSYQDIKYPSEGECFDYFYSHETNEWGHWQTKLEEYEHPGMIGEELEFFDITVSTVDSTRLSYIMDLLVNQQQPIMFVGGAGTGKTSTIQNYLHHGADEKYLTCNINMNYYTDSKILQTQMENPIDKRSGRRYGPPTGKKLIYFVDDINLPYIEEYGTQNALSLLRQHFDYESFYDREDLGLKKEVVDVQYVSAMNPTAGSFTITERLQRHFSTFTCTMPSRSDLNMIYNSVFCGHLEMGGFDNVIRNICASITEAALSLHEQVVVKFLPSAIKFVYNWNMRELDNVFTGMTTMKPEQYDSESKVFQLFAHECKRVFYDRLVDDIDMEKFDTILKDVCNKSFGEIKKYKADEVFTDPLIFTNFMELAGGLPIYVAVDEYEKLKDTLDAKLAEYNESNTIMELVLFKDAMKHIARISRIISKPRGNALLIGVGGSGKQSLSRLAAYICGYEVRQLAVSSRYGVEDFKEDLRQMYIGAGVKGLGIMFLLTDSQIIDDRFLIYVNDVLSSGFIPDLFAKDELDSALNGVRNLAKQAGVPDTPATLLEFFIKRVRQNLHVCCCVSPVGEVFRVRARRFPGLVNCTVMDRFLAWPHEALISVALIFLQETELPSDDVRKNIAEHMAMVHTSVTTTSQDYLKAQRRYNYVTPKSFLELIEFYKTLLGQKRTTVRNLIDRLDTGLATLAKTEKDVSELQVNLQHTMVKVAEKVEATNKLMETMATETSAAKVQQDAAAIEKEKSEKASAKASKIEESASAELAEAKPAMDAAAAAVDVLNSNAITELKGFKSLPSGVDIVMTCIQMMYKGEMSKKKHTWDNAKKMMKDGGKFLADLKAYDASAMSEALIKGLEPLVSLDVMEYENMVKKSFAAANLAAFAVNSYKYNRIYVKVKPLMDALNQAQKEKAAADESLATAMAIVSKVEAKLKELGELFTKATNEKREVEEEAERCNVKLGLANRLTNGLASEKTRWGIEVGVLKTSEALLVGNVLLSAAFVSYIGAFDAGFRNRLWKETWFPDIIARSIPIIEEARPLDQLTDDGTNAKMYGEGLPADRISTENGSIILNCKRWPLIIDPQLQGIKWIRGKEGAVEGNTLVVLQLSQGDWPRRIEGAIQNGFTVIIENITADLDSTLDPVLARAIYKKGRAYYLNFGGEEIEYDMNFKLYLQTKLPNPHYPPEIAAQCTLINFTSTELGLEDQLLAKIVNVEKPELEEKKQELIDNFNRYKIELLELENNLLERLANAPEDILSDVPLIEGLEATKKASTEIAAAVKLGKETEIQINLAREVYRPAATEASMIYFMLTDLNVVNYMYQYSLDAFTFFFFRAIDIAAASEESKQRVLNLIKSLRFVLFQWVVRGLFERDKLILMSQLTFKLLLNGKIGDEPVNRTFFNFLLRAPKKADKENPLDWLPNPAWNTVQALAELEGFDRLPADLQEASPRFKEWYNQLRPEDEKLPLDYSRLDKYPLQKMLVVRALRPDRMTMAMRGFIRNVLPDGKSYIEADATNNSVQVLTECLLQSSPATPLFFILSPGVDVVADVDKCAVEYNMVRFETYHNISMGQGQDPIAMSKLEVAHKQGHWVILNNIHLMPTWCIELEKKLDAFALEGSHQKMRVFLTAEPSNGIPIGILARCIKLTNEPPAGMQANVNRALSTFNPSDFNDLEPKVRAIIYGLCHFHAIVMERKKFGPMGYNIMYPFGLGDLRDSAICLYNYMESAPSKIPWVDLRYIFGQIIYGGHIVNDNDRLLVMTYLEWYMKDELLDESEMFPFVDGTDRNATLKSPLPSEHAAYVKHVDDNMKTDTPLIFGLHPNAEIGFRTAASNSLFMNLTELQPKTAGDGDSGVSAQDIARAKIDDIKDKISEVALDLDETISAIDDRGPFENVFLQEMSILIKLVKEMRRSLKELVMGFNGELSMSSSMEQLEECLFIDKVPPGWGKIAWPSLRNLSLWVVDLLNRVNQIQEWSGNPNEIPRCTWLGGLIIPESFLTAIKQIGAQRNNLELDKLVTLTDVTKKTHEQIDQHAKDGAFISGFYMQGARWDAKETTIAPSLPKEMYFEMPVMLCKAITRDKDEDSGIFRCPVYKAENRGPTFVFSAQLKSKSPPGRWVLAGVGLIFDVAG
jgi:dynein heavy chain